MCCDHAVQVFAKLIIDAEALNGRFPFCRTLSAVLHLQCCFDYDRDLSAVLPGDSPSMLDEVREWAGAGF